jgi:hypothetical protein
MCIVVLYKQQKTQPAIESFYGPYTTASLIPTGLVLCWSTCHALSDNNKTAAMTLIPTWFLSEYKTSYLKQAVTSLPHQSSIYNTEDSTNHFTEPGRCHGNFSTHTHTHTHTHTGSPQWLQIQRPFSPCSSACFTEELKCWPPASK